MDQATPPPPKRAKPGPHRYQKGKPKLGGRKQGSTNKVPRLLKECLVMAAELEGMDRKGKDELVGFLRHLARKDIKSFAGLLGRIIPFEIESRNISVEVTYRSVEEVQREMASRGISPELMQSLLEYHPVIDHEGAEDIEVIEDDR